MRRGADGRVGTSRFQGTLLVVLLAGLAALVRGIYLSAQDLPVHDPWRHLLLIDHLRRGLGFTLFDGQPYLWYSPVWYYLCAALPAAFGPGWIAGVFSVAGVVAFHAWQSSAGLPRSAVLLGTLVFALCGPAVAYTCHYGPEAFALTLVLSALALAARSTGSLAALASGALFGVALAARMNFVFDLLLLIPWVRSRRRGAAMLLGLGLPLGLTWWRNHEIIRSFPYVFTWDGLATRTADFGPLSTLVIQLHPAVREALRRLHVQIVPLPEWLATPGQRPAWALLLFMVAGIACLLACRRLHLVLAGGLALLYFLALDGTGSSHFFRIYLGLFPVFFAALAALAAREGRAWRLAAAILAGAMLVGGATRLVPEPMVPLEMVTPPESLLTGDAYFVNSTFYHPESLLYRYPGREFLGLPLYPEQLEEFRRHYPRRRDVLWHDFSVQDELRRHLVESGDFELVARGANSFGRGYEVLRERRPGSGLGDQGQDVPDRGTLFEAWPRGPSPPGQAFVARTR